MARILCLWLLAFSEAIPEHISPVEASEDPPLRILAAASLIGPLSSDSIEGANVQTVFGSSGVLARQIAAGAPADIYISADPHWIDWLITRHPALAKQATREFARNRLVLIEPKGQHKRSERTDSLHDTLTALSADEPIAIGDPNHVPAGRYAKQALLSAGLWETLQGRLIHAANVRAALAYVENGATAAGIVYASDARQSRKVVELARIDEGMHDPIIYVMLRLSDRPAAIDLFERLSSPIMAEQLSRFGFLPPMDLPS